MSSTKDKIGIMERRRALETARNIVYSKVGKVVLEDNRFPDRTLEIKVKRLDGESKKNQVLIDNKKKMFKRNRLIYNLEPTILIERPASPVAGRHHIHSDSNEIPHYMTELKRTQTPGNFDLPPTIDAFTLLKRKTRNIWETQIRDEDMTRQFRSILMKSPALDNEEYNQLDKGYASHRPPSTSEKKLQERIEEKRRERIELIRENQTTPAPDPVLTFITQLDREAESRSSRRTRATSRASRLSAAKNNLPIELEFNPKHIEIFEKIRAKQKVKFFNNMKL